MKACASTDDLLRVHENRILVNSVFKLKIWFLRLEVSSNLLKQGSARVHLLRYPERALTLILRCFLLSCSLYPSFVTIDPLKQLFLLQ